jgi:hypothetical protein
VKDHIDILVLSYSGHRPHFDRLKQENSKAIRPGQQVRIDGRREIFVVLRIDRERHLADLLRQGSLRTVQSGIHLSALRVVGEPEVENPLPVSA